MLQALLKWCREAFRKVVTSIAFIPAIITILFLGLSFGMIILDFSSVGKGIKANLHWLSLKDASTARSICSAIVSGIISLAVFSFSMVMILLNQVASQMTNRILGTLIGNRFQQYVLGFYIGTIVYALFLLSTIRDINTGIYVPAISTYLLIILAVADIFLFIYFLHYITNSVKFETIINKIHKTTKNQMVKRCLLTEMEFRRTVPAEVLVINANTSGLYFGFARTALLSLCKKYDITIKLLNPPGVYIIEGNPILTVYSKHPLPGDFEKNLRVLISTDHVQEIDENYIYGFTQLMEIAVKALSPGINDPGTAVISLNALGDLLAFRQQHFPEIYLKDEHDTVRIIMNEKSFDDIFIEIIQPIWDYGHQDRMIQKAVNNICTQLNNKKPNPIIEKLLHVVSLQLLKNNIN